MGTITTRSDTAATGGDDNTTRTDVAASVVFAFAVAVALPLLELLGREAAFFVAHDTSGVEVVAFGVTISILIPAALAAVTILLGEISHRVGRWLHVALLTVLIMALCVQAVDRVPLPGSTSWALVQVVLAAVATALAVRWYFSSAEVRNMVRLGFMVPPAVLVLFLVVSPASRLVLPASAEAQGPRREAKPVPVVMVVFDEFPVPSIMDAEGSIDPVNFPTLARLARDGIWFRNATTVHESTTSAIPSMLTGNYPRHGALPISKDHPQNVFEFVRDTHAVHAIEPITDLCPSDLCTERRERPSPAVWLRRLASDTAVVTAHIVVPEFLTEQLPPIGDKWTGFTGREDGGATNGEEGLQDRFRAALDEDRAATFQSFIGRLGSRDDSPAFHFLHSMLPHHPWEYLPSGIRHAAPNELPALDGKQWVDDEWLVAQAFQRHLLQVGYVDRLLGELVETLEGAGIYEDSLLIVTADHGASFAPGGLRRTVEPTTVGEIAAVPLFIKQPHESQGQVSDAPAETIDIAPTIADVLGVNLSSDVDGSSLLGEGPPNRREKRIGTSDGRTIGFLAGGTQKDQASDRKFDWFHSVDGSINPWALRPHGSLLGRAVADITEGEGEPRSNSVRLVTTRAIKRKTGGSDLTYVHGRFRTTKRIDQPVHLALSVDGEIVGLTRTFDHRGHEASFEVVLPPGLPDGVEIRVFEVNGAGIVPVRDDTGATYEVVGDADGQKIVGSTGVELPIRQDAIQGFVESIRTDGNEVVIGGWAGDTTRGLPVESILVFSDERFLHQGMTPKPRGGVAEAFGEPRLSQAGFQVNFLVDDDVGRSDRIRVFAILEGVASELKVHREAR